MLTRGTELCFFSLFTEPDDLLLSLFSLQIEKMHSGLHAMYVISIVTLLLTILGVYGACKEKQWPLIVVGESFQWQ